jgi:hypothetical protein
MNASAAVQAAVFTLLSADATLRGLTGTHPDNVLLARVYDEPPEGAAFPYVVIGNVVERANNRMGGKVGRTLDLFVEAWSEVRHWNEVNGLTSRVDDLLDNVLTLAVTGYTVELLNLLECTNVKTSRSGTPLRQGIAHFQIDVVET